MTDAVASGPPPFAGTRPLRLAFLGNADSVHMQRWAGFFASRGHVVDLVSMGSMSDADSAAPYRVHRLGSMRTAVIRVRDVVNGLAPDIVHAHYVSHYGWLGWLAGRRPYVVTAWGSDILIDAARSVVRRKVARLVLRGAACVTADSGDVVEALIRLGADRARVHEIQFGVDSTRFAPGPPPGWLVDRLGVAGRRVLFSPRSMTPLYRTLVIVEALRNLPDDVVLVATLAGADPAYRRAVEDAVREHGLDGRVILVPTIPHDEIDAYYRLSDVVVSVPASDGTPVSLLEAMSTGVPVVATRLPAVAAWLAPVDDRLLVPVDDVTATTAAVRRALEMDPATRASVTGAARAIVVDKGDHAANMLRMEELYRGLVSR